MKMMKKINVVVFLFLLALKLNAADTILLDFETTSVPSNVESWLNYSQTGTSASTWGATSPLKDETNNTEGCYKIVKTSADPYWTGLEVTLANAVTITSETRYMHVLAYKSTTSRIALTYTPENGSQSSDAWQSNATTGAWIDYVLNIPVGTKLKTFAIKIADDAGDYYFDQITLTGDGTSSSRTTVFVDPGDQRQVLEGWGASLCWWANVMGGYSDAKLKTLCNWITDPDGLNMNIFRFNMGGGDDPSHNHMRSDGGDMPGYKASADAAYDWTQDENQRRILQQLIASRIEKAGVNDIQIVGFSNSPPYWMTRSGCSAGSTEGNVTNLKSDMFDDFADYLTEVARHYHDDLEITFNYIEPFNEPQSTWWKANGGQEGCYFSTSDQTKMVKELYRKLEEKNMLDYCAITASDENTIDQTYSVMQAYKKESGLLSMFDLISTHSYGGNYRSLLADWADANHKKLWQSESGPLYVGTTYESQIMIMADRTITDLRDLRCTAWCDWQIGGTGDLSNSWALVVSNYDDNMNPITRNTNYYIRSQFSRFLKAGYTILGTSDSKTVAAISPDKKELVVVISNSNAYTQKFKVDLSGFTSFGKVKQFRTRAAESYNVKNSEDRFIITGKTFIYDALSESVTTFVIPINQSSVGSSQFNKSLNQIYFSGKTLYTNLTGTNTAEASVYNLAGQLLVSDKNIPVQGHTQFDLSRGMYLVFLKTDSEKYAKRIIVIN